MQTDCSCLFWTGHIRSVHILMSFVMPPPFLPSTLRTTSVDGLRILNYELGLASLSCEAIGFRYEMTIATLMAECLFTSEPHFEAHKAETLEDIAVWRDVAL